MRKLAITLAFFILGNTAFAATDGVDFKTLAPEAEIKELKSFYTQNDARGQLASNLLAKNYPLTEYEMIVLGEDIRRELRSPSKALSDISALLRKHTRTYEYVAQKTVPDAPRVAEPSNAPSEPVNPFANIPMPDPVRTPVEESVFQEVAQAARTPEEKKQAFSLINILPSGNSEPTEAVDTSVTPATQFRQSEDQYKLVKADVEQSSSSDELKELIALVNDSAFDKGIKEAKDFYTYAYHSFDYVYEHGTGNVPLRTDVINDEGKYFQPSVVNQRQMEHALEVGIGTKITDFVDLLVGVTVKNEDGLIFSPGTTWEFSSLHIVPRFGTGLGKLKKEAGVDLSDDGKTVGVEIGHGTKVVGDTETGEIGLSAKGDAGKVAITRSGQLSGRSANGKWFFGLGKLSLDFSTYTLKLSECKAIQVGYQDDNQSFTFIVGRPNAEDNRKLWDGTPTVGKYDRLLYGAQYVIKNAIPNMTLAFNFAKADDRGSLDVPNGAVKRNASVYSIAFNSESMKDTSIQGEFAHSVNKLETGESYSGNADYLDITHRFSNRLSGSLHLVNIDQTFDADSLVEDRTGDYLYTTNAGDGFADYLYKSGQRGLDFELQYKFPEDAALSFGYTRYSLTTDGNSKTRLYLAGNKNWTITDDDGNQRAQISLQQRFEHNRVSTEPNETQRLSATTLSVSGEPWKNAEFETNYQHIIDNAEGNEKRFDISLAQNWYPLDRVKITPSIEYEKKVGDPGYRDGIGEGGIDSSTLIASLAIGYQIVPDELTVTFLVSKERYKVAKSEIDEATGRKVDGEDRAVMGAGVGLQWEPKKIPGLTAAVSYRKDRVQYYTPTVDLSHQDIWEYSLEYSRPVGKNIKAAISYDYRSARDRAKPIYNETTKTIAVSLDATLGKTSTLRLEHRYELEDKPLDPSANYTTQTTIARVYNSF